MAKLLFPKMKKIKFLLIVLCKASSATFNVEADIFLVPTDSVHVVTKWMQLGQWLLSIFLILIFASLLMFLVLVQQITEVVLWIVLWFSVTNKISFKLT